MGFNSFILLKFTFMRHFIWIFFVSLTLGAIAQEDDLPPPSPRVKKSDGEWKPVESTEKKDDFKPFSKKKKIDLSKFIIEPNFNFSIGNNQIDIGLSPYVGYRVWQPKNVKSGSMQGLCLGGGLTYYFTRFSNLEFSDPSGAFRFYANARFHTYGGGVFAQYNIWKGFFTRVKFEVLHRDLDDLNNAYLENVGIPPNNSYRVAFPRIQKTIPSLLVGVGYNLLQSRNFFFPITVSYNVLHSVVDRTYSLYPRGVVVQLGFINLF